MKKFLLVITLSGICFFAKSQTYNNEWIDYSKTYYKFNVGATGLYHISQASLAGIGLGGTATQNFQLWRQGVEVRVSTRLIESPSCLVADERDMGGNLARILKAAGQKVPDAAPILEINPDHAMIKRLKAEDPALADWAGLLFDQALLAEGGQLEDPAGFVKRSNLLLLALAAK